MNLCLSPFLQGCGTSAALIIAIGAQNVFALKQGILKNHIFTTALIFSLTDALLIALGVGGFGTILTQNTMILSMARWGGAAFLAWYGFRSFRAVFQNSSLNLEEGFIPDRPDFKTTIATILILSFLNPHVYLDTVLLLGSIGAQFPPYERVLFGIGAMMISFIWFFVLAYGAQYLAPLFKKPISWKILDFLTGCMMWIIAFSLIFVMDHYCPC